MSRPKGSKDKQKRATKDLYSHKDVIHVNNLFSSGMTFEQVEKETKWSYHQLKRMKNKPDISVKQMVKKLDITCVDKICGIYAIAFFPLNKRAVWYIGSSIDICSRIKSHISGLRGNNHFNKTMQEFFSNNIPMSIFLFKECNEAELIKEENLIINQYCKGCLINQWSLPENMIEFYEKAAENFSSDKYTVNGDCWIWKSTKRGYGRAMSISINGEKKYLPPHRVSLFIKTGNIPSLVRHKCDNKACVNPNHLIEGSYAENSKDFYESNSFKEKKKQKENNFEELWLQNNGDIEAISKNTNYGKNRCYYYQKILRLKERYPQITEEKYRIIKEKHRKISRGRGPQKENLKDKIINDWKCIDEWVSKNSHKWQCIKCGNIRHTSKTGLKKYPKCKRCKFKNLAIDVLSEIQDISNIKINGMTIGIYHFDYEELI